MRHHLRLSLLALTMLILLPVVAFGQSGDEQNGPREIAEGVVWEPIVGTPPGARDGIDVSVGLSRYTLQPGAVLDLVALLGYGFAGPVQFYVEQGVMTVTAAPGDGFVYSTTHVPDFRAPREGDVEVPARAAVYAPTGEIGPVRNEGDEVLVMLAIAIVPDSIYDVTAEEFAELTGATGSPAP